MEINGKKYVFVQYFRNRRDAENYVKKKIREGRWLKNTRKYKIRQTDNKTGWNIWQPYR